MSSWNRMPSFIDWSAIGEENGEKGHPKTANKAHQRPCGIFKCWCRENGRIQPDDGKLAEDRCQKPCNTTWKIKLEFNHQSVMFYRNFGTGCAFFYLKLYAEFIGSKFRSVCPKTIGTSPCYRSRESKCIELHVLWALSNHVRRVYTHICENDHPVISTNSSFLDLDSHKTTDKNQSHNDREADNPDNHRDSISTQQHLALRGGYKFWWESRKRGNTRGEKSWRRKV